VVFGVILAGLFGAHELMVKLAGDRASPLLVKELGVAVIFTAGTWGLPWLVHHHESGHWFGWPVMVIVQYFLLAMVNLIEFSIYEARRDAIDHQTSMVQYAGRPTAARVTAVLLIAQTCLTAVAVAITPCGVVVFSEIVLQLMAAGLWVILLMPRLAARRERYRSLGDGVFLLPLLLGLWHSS
jgi:hypothetical protein